MYRGQASNEAVDGPASLRPLDGTSDRAQAIQLSAYPVITGLARNEHVALANLDGGDLWRGAIWPGSQQPVHRLATNTHVASRFLRLQKKGGDGGGGNGPLQLRPLLSEDSLSGSQMGDAVVQLLDHSYLPFVRPD